MKNERSLDLIKPWGYIGYSILFSIPVIGGLLVIILSFAAKRTNLKFFARYWLWCGIIAIVLGIIIYLAAGQTIIELLRGYGLPI